MVIRKPSPLSRLTDPALMISGSIEQVNIAIAFTAANFIGFCKGFADFGFAVEHNRMFDGGDDVPVGLGNANCEVKWCEYFKY